MFNFLFDSFFFFKNDMFSALANLAACQSAVRPPQDKKNLPRINCTAVTRIITRAHGDRFRFNFLIDKPQFLKQ